ncbi:MAG: FAD-dependent oxidoreductase [bacterium]
MAADTGGRKVVVVGAGIAGLTAACELHRAGHHVTVLEKDRQAGGRMSTQHLFGGVFDDGAQFFTVKDQRFGAFVDDWVNRGIVVDWFHSQLIQGGGSNPDGFPRYCGVNGMNSIIQDLAEGLTLRFNSEVQGIEHRKDHYMLSLGDGTSLDAEAVILTTPAPISLGILETFVKIPDRVEFAALSEIIYGPCITVLARLEGESALTEWGGLRISGDYIDWIADNRRKGISPNVTTITIQAMPEFSREHWDDDDNRVAERLLESAMKILQSEPVEYVVRRWEHAKPQSVHPDTCFEVGGGTLLLAGDGFQGYRVEGAAISGQEAARSLVKYFGKKG